VCSGPLCANHCPNGYAKTKFGCTTCTCAGKNNFIYEALIRTIDSDRRGKSKEFIPVFMTNASLWRLCINWFIFWPCWILTSWLLSRVFLSYVHYWLLLCRTAKGTHVQYCRTDTDRYLQLTVRKFRTDRHSCLRTVICGWQSVCFARTVILAYGPLFAVDGQYISHRPSFLLTVRIQSVHLIIAPGPTVDGPYISHGQSSLLTDHHLRLTVRTFRTDRHPCLQTVIYDSRSVCRGINSLYKYDWASLFKRTYEASEIHQRGRKRRR